jgi:hypothetical protein
LKMPQGLRRIWIFFSTTPCRRMVELRYSSMHL